jgi:aminotransferase
MTGWRLGYALAPSHILEYMLKIHQFGIMSSPTMSQYAAVKALQEGEKDIVAMRNAYNQRRRYILDAFKEMGLPCFEPYGAFYVFPDISEFGLHSEEFCQKFLEEENVAIVPGVAFGECADNYVRISYACSLNEIREAMKRLSKFLKRLRSNPV